MSEPADPTADESGVYLVRLAKAAIATAVLTYATYAVMRHADELELYVRRVRAAVESRARAAREWRRARNTVLFEAEYATREAARDVD